MRSRPNRASTASQVLRVEVRSVTTTASNGSPTASHDATSGAPTKRRSDASGSTTAMMVIPASSAQMAAISARSDLPANATRVRPRPCAACEQRRAVRLGLPEEPEGIGQVFDGKPRLLGKALRGEIVDVAPRRRLVGLEQAFLDAALEVGVDEPERDPEFGREPALRLAAVPFDGIEQAQHDPGVVDVPVLLDALGCLGCLSHRTLGLRGYGMDS